MSCVDGCMSEKAKAQAPKTGAPVGYGSSSLATSTVSASLASMARQVEIAPPEKWQDEADFVQCPKCSAKKVKTHNCRVCGLCFCDKVRDLEQIAVRALARSLHFGLMLALEQSDFETSCRGS